ncbi:aminotransferase class III-fold pyridoxal phosphate-dependent enzyme [Streptomyces orinoci]|uniref:Diaminobutyrate--2-oxoglutarate transaminase n=1 Tax=Streptomyces orinoci TaxID=67339 RepID=A0ABV3K2H0_STRON
MGLTQSPPPALPDAASAARAAQSAAPACPLPIVPVRARGLIVEGADGRRYLDCFPGAGALVLGHNHPVVLEAVRSVLDGQAPLYVPGLATPAERAFTGELLRTLPGGLAESARIRFCGPGDGEAVTAALELVRAATGRDGCLVSPATVSSDDRLRRMRDTAAAHSVPFVVDESRTGVGRTGAFWAVEHSQVVPDVMVLSGAVGGGLPLAAVVHREDLGPPPAEGSTFRGNQLALAAGAATLRYVRERQLAERARVLGGRMLSRLRRLALEHRCVGGVRGRGLMLEIELLDHAEALRQECLRRGLMVGIGTRPFPLVHLLPPLTITDEQAEAVLARLADALAEISRPARHGPAFGERRSVSGEDRSVSDEDRSVSGEARAAPGEPSSVSGGSRSVPGEARLVSGESESASGGSRPVFSEPQPVPGERQPVPAEPQPVSGKRRSVPGESQPAPGEVQSVSGGSRLVSGKRRSVPGESQPAPGEGQPAPGEPQPFPGEPLPAPREPHPAPSQPKEEGVAFPA